MRIQNMKTSLEMLMISLGLILDFYGNKDDSSEGG